MSRKARAVNELGKGEEGGELFCGARDGIKCRMWLYEALWTGSISMKAAQLAIGVLSLSCCEALLLEGKRKEEEGRS